MTAATIRVPATIRVRRPSGTLATFEAEHVDIDNGLITATGRWADDRQRRHRTLSWGAPEIVEIRWTREAVPA